MKKAPTNMLYEEDKCVKCRQDFLDYSNKCDSYLLLIHKTCAIILILIHNLKQNAFPQKNKEGKKASFHICEDCKVRLNRMPFMIKMIDKMKKDMETSKSEMKKDKEEFKFKLKPPLMREPYATVIQNNQINEPKIKLSLPTLVTKPKVTQD